MSGPNPNLVTASAEPWFQEAMRKLTEAAKLLEAHGVGDPGGVTLAILGDWHLMRLSRPMPRSLADGEQESG